MNGAEFIFWEKHRREIFVDLDGSLTNNGVKDGKTYYVTPYYAHFDPLIDGTICKNLTNWDVAIRCDGSLT